MKIASRSVGLISKKTNFSRAARFFDFLCRCFAPPQSPFVRLKRQTCRMCLTKICFLCPCSLLFFHCPALIFTWPLAFLIFSPPLWNFTCFSSNEIRLPSSFSVIHVSVNIKTNVEKDTTCWFFFLSKSPGGNFLPLHSGSYGSWLSYFILVCLWCGLTASRSGQQNRKTGKEKRSTASLQPRT